MVGLEPFLNLKSSLFDPENMSMYVFHRDCFQLRISQEQPYNIFTQRKQLVYLLKHNCMGDEKMVSLNAWCKKIIARISLRLCP